MSKSAGGLTAAAKVLGAAGGKKGGPARARALSSGERKAIAAKGGKASARKRTVTAYGKKSQKHGGTFT